MPKGVAELWPPTISGGCGASLGSQKSGNSPLTPHIGHTVAHIAFHVADINHTALGWEWESIYCSNVVSQWLCGYLPAILNGDQFARIGEHEVGLNKEKIFCASYASTRDQELPFCSASILIDFTRYGAQLTISTAAGSNIATLYPLLSPSSPKWLL